MVPEGADAVARLEDASLDEGGVVVRTRVPVGANIRRRGEDVPAGRTVVEAGMVMGPGQVAATAALGGTHVTVVRRPRVAIVPTGDEVRPPGDELGVGQIHDAVSAALALLLRELGAVPRRRPVAPDDPQGLLIALREAGASADMVLTVGGASRGDRDAVHALAGAGDVESLLVALRPAKPFVLGRIFGVPLFGLPGNPAAALAAFEEFVRPAVLAQMGRAPVPRPSATAILAEPLRQPPGRLHLVRVEVWRDGGRLRARAAGLQGAGMIHSLARANAWAVIPADIEELAAGSEIEVRMLTDPL
jgi:molybdenum cofactor synthesis domain-containing protein